MDGCNTGLPDTIHGCNCLRLELSSKEGETMEIINKLHKDVAMRCDTATPTVSITRVRFSFSGIVAEQAKMRIGRYVHFILEGNCWAFVVNDKDTGFRLFNPQRAGAPVNTVCIHSTSLCDMFRRKMKVSGNVKYYVQKTGSEFEGQPVFEILTHKPIIKVGSIE